MFARIRGTWLICFFATYGLINAAPVACRGADPASPGVKLVVAFGDGVEKHFTNLSWKAEMTVLDALQLADRHPRGIDMEVRGRGATAFVHAIDGQKNEASGRGWLYKVNGKLADRSCGIYELERGDTVLWSFENYR